MIESDKNASSVEIAAVRSTVVVVGRHRGLPAFGVSSGRWGRAWWRFILRATDLPFMSPQQLA